MWQWVVIYILGSWCALLTWTVLKHVGNPMARAHPVSPETRTPPYETIDILRDMRDPAARLAIEECSEQLRQVRAKVDKIDGRLESTWDDAEYTYLAWLVRKVRELNGHVERIQDDQGAIWAIMREADNNVQENKRLLGIFHSAVARARLSIKDAYLQAVEAEEHANRAGLLTTDGVIVQPPSDGDAGGQYGDDR